MSDPSNLPIRIGISSCLVGEQVRFDGNHKQDYYITGTLSMAFEFVPLCPEVAIGMGVPRPPIRLVGSRDSARAVGVKDASLDVTDKLVNYGQRMAPKLSTLSGYIFKAKSPSCGMARVKLYDGHGGGSKQGVGLYAGEIMRALPLLPVEEEGRLGDPALRDNFLERVFAYHRWQTLTRQRLSAKALIDFHSRHKLALLAHGTEGYRQLGRMLGDISKQPLAALAERYIGAFMHALAQRATCRRHTNVLQHIMGYLKKSLSADDKQELLDLIHAYRLEQIPRIVPITLLKHHFRKYPNEYIAQQTYLNPSSLELKLRSYF